jgi:hypothetical protein
VLHFGDTLKPMTRRQRITVTKDEALANALERMRPFFPGKPAAALVHDLAIKGAIAIEEDEPRIVDEVRRAEAMERLVEWSITLPGLDRDVLLHAEEGWGWNR